MIKNIPVNFIRFRKNLKWQITSNLLQAGLGGLYLLLIGRVLELNEFGILSIILALVSVFGQIFDFRIQDLAMRDFHHLDTSNKNKKKSFLIIDLLSIETMSRVLSFTFLMIYSLYFINKNKLGDDALYFIFIAGLGFLFSKIGSSLTVGLFRVLNKANYTTFFLSLDWGLRLLISIIISLFFKISIEAILLINLCVGAVVNIIQILSLKKILEPKYFNLKFIRWNFKESFKRIFKQKNFLITNLSISLSDLVAKDLDILIIAIYLSLENIAIYKMAKNFIYLTWKLIDPFHLTLLPELMKINKKNTRDTLVRFILQISKWLFIFSIFIVFAGFLLLKFFVIKLLGKGYESIDYVYLVMSIWISIGALFVWVHPLSIAINRPKYAFWGSFFGALIGLPFFYYLTQKYGVYGSSFASAISIGLSFLISAFLLKRFITNSYGGKIL
jgi:O-antigen/teichoic acid export membrane protein